MPQNIFSPDGDGYNDEYAIDIEGYEKFSMVITDLRGNIVFQTNNPADSWNGKIGNIGADCPAGIENYAVLIVYQLKGQDEPVKFTDKISIQR